MSNVIFWDILEILLAMGLQTHSSRATSSSVSARGVDVGVASSVMVRVETLSLDASETVTALTTPVDREKE